MTDQEVFPSLQKAKATVISARQASTAEITERCEHLPEHKKCKDEVYPSFNVGLYRPFALLLRLCSICAKKATIDSILTDERWERMEKALRENDERVPSRDSVTMNLEKTRWVQDEMIDYSYALAC
jgi:hypothetical protein